MIHHGQDLLFNLKALEDGSRIHSKFQDFYRDFSFVWLDLLRQPDHTKATLPDFGF